jgi:hypothetical protein
MKYFAIAVILTVTIFVGCCAGELNHKCKPCESDSMTAVEYYKTSSTQNDLAIQSAIQSYLGQDIAKEEYYQKYLRCLQSCVIDTLPYMPTFVQGVCAGTCAGCVGGNLLSCVGCATCIGTYGASCAVECAWTAPNYSK